MTSTLPRILTPDIQAQRDTVRRTALTGMIALVQRVADEAHITLAEAAAVIVQDGFDTVLDQAGNRATRHPSNLCARTHTWNK